MLTLTFAGDESGDVSLAFDKGASRYFVVAAIATADPDALRQLLADVRQASGLPAEYEFSFNALSSAPLRSRVFAALTGADFESWAVVVDRTTLSDPFRIMRRLDFYLYFVTELIRLIPPDKREGATLILDEFGSAHDATDGVAPFPGGQEHSAQLQAHCGQAIEERTFDPGRGPGGRSDSAPRHERQGRRL